MNTEFNNNNNNTSGEIPREILNIGVQATIAQCRKVALERKVAQAVASTRNSNGSGSGSGSGDQLVRVASGYYLVNRGADGVFHLTFNPRRGDYPWALFDSAGNHLGSAREMSGLTR